MPLIAAAMCPHPTVLIPDIAGNSRGEWDELRAACAESIRQLEIPAFDVRSKSRRPAVGAADLVVVVGGDDRTRSFDPSGTYGSLRAAGIQWEYGCSSWAKDRPA
ncbi:hypothetical protein [Nocardia otitidiscaviarum]|uniref:hypothetical protein n=1 Tax=Nocardia otitidiscaviarum TaxID=1823 RepID=UPI0024540969|nr:hypothetical protein [Nocardia otitidiscaviarum]